MLLPIELDAATVIIVVQRLLVALTIPYDENRFIRRSLYDGKRYGVVLEGNIDTGFVVRRCRRRRRVNRRLDTKITIDWRCDRLDAETLSIMLLLFGDALSYDEDRCPRYCT